ncbi:MAG TPA: hypothetical protein VLA73_10440 [Burkholderiales bacterium]|nr:hypothetical protein [Burkholderiales bacterium]
MSARVLVCLSAHQATCAYWKHGRLTGCEVFPNTIQGWSGFGAYLHAHRNVSVYLMVDVVKEDYRYELLPHAVGRDRKEILARKLKQHYRNTPYSTGWAQGRENTKRRDDRYLFAAVTSPELLDDWLRVIAQEHAPLEGIYLLPLVSQLLVEKLELGPGNLLMVSQHTAGLRQSFFNEGRLRVSRLIPAESGGRPAPVESYADEIANTRFYLDSLRIAPLDEALAMLLLNPNGSLTALEALLSGPPNVRCHLMGAEEIAERTGMDADLLCRYPDALHLHILGLRAPQANLAPPALVMGHQRQQTRRILNAISATATTVSALWCGLNFMHQLDYEAQTEDIIRERRRVQASYEQVTKQFPASPASAEELRKTIEIANKLKTKTSSPELFFGAVSRALDASPSVSLSRLSWKSGNGEQGSAQAVNVQTGLIEAEIRPFKGDYREALFAINKFQEKLKAEPAITSVKVLQLPLNINPDTALSGSTLESRESHSGASFKLEAVFREAA